MLQLDVSDVAAFVQAAGTLGGTQFTQNSYWRLIFTGGHHLMTEDFTVLFDSPIDGACGLKVLVAGDPLPTVSTIDCDLSDIESYGVTSSVSEELE